MSEITTIATALRAIFDTVLSKLVNAAWTTNKRHVIDNALVILNGIRIKQLVKEAKGVLDKGKGPDLKRLTHLATILTVGEFYGDIIKHISHHKFEANINWDNLEKRLHNFEKELGSELDKHPENQSSGHENEGESTGHENEGDPPGNVRRGLLYLSRFPTNYVFNRQRISRLLVAHEFVAADEPLLKQLTNWLDRADSSWDGDRAPNHFLIGNNVKNRTPTWPESHNLVREVLAESIASIEYEIFCSSLIFLGQRNYTLKLEEEKFLFLKVLSLRNGKLENEKYLKELSFLKYLDLKNTIVHDCSWLEGLEELEMLDLRYTGVKKIPEEYLEKLGKLQHLLLGYCPNKNDNWLAGAQLNTVKLTKNLKTLRAIEMTDEIKVSLEVADLSVTGLNTGQLEFFWDAVGKFENLTRLGVAVTKDSGRTLEHCPPKLKKKLKRLRMEGLHSGLQKLGEFVNLVDLTLASHKPIDIDIDSIPKLEKLFCLRLYSLCTKTTLILEVQRFKKLKKLVIGDMENVETVAIASDVFKTVDTFKFCNLPKLLEVTYHDLKSEPPLLRRRESKTVPAQIGTELHKYIFLRGFGNMNMQFDKMHGLKIYHYDMNKQCYQEVHAI